MKMKTILPIAALLGLVCTCALPATPGYELTERIALGAVTKWDYAAIDQPRQRLYVTRGDHVDVVQLPAGKLIATIPNTQGVHGVAFANDLKLGFTSNGKSNSVTVFDLETMKPTAEVKLTGKNPDAILYEPTVRKLYVFNGGSANVDVIDAARLQVVHTLAATGRPEFAVSDGQGKVFFNIEDNAGINVIDTATDKLVHRWKLDDCDGPSGLAMDVRNARLFSACANGMAVVTDAATGRRVSQFPVGEHPDAVIYDAETRTVLTSGGGGSGSLTITTQDDANHYTARGTLPTLKGAKTMAMDAVTKTVYLPTAVGEQFVLLVAKRKD